MLILVTYDVNVTNSSGQKRLREVAKLVLCQDLAQVKMRNLSSS